MIQAQDTFRTKSDEIAAKVMKEHEVPTHDLFTVSKERMKELMREANVHYHGEGNKVLSKLVADRIAEDL